MPPYDPFSPEFAITGIPFDELAALRREAPVSRTARGSLYFAKRADIELLLKNTHDFQGDSTVSTGIDGIAAVPPELQFLNEVLPPYHRDLRMVFLSVLNGHRSGVLDGPVREICDRLIDAFDTTAPIDIQADYAAQIPAFVMAEIMGFDADVAPEFMRWAGDGSVLARYGVPGIGPEGPEIQQWLRSAIHRHRAGELDSPVIQKFLDARSSGEPISDTRIVSQLQTLVMGGIHTTRTVILHCVQRLLFDAQLFDRIRGDRELIPAFIEESLRLDSPAQRVTRVCLTDVEVAGTTIRSGDVVEVGIASGNRDEDFLEAADEFRLDRPNPRDHIAFGAGAHVCPGAGLARLEVSTALNALLDRVVTMQPVDGHRYPPVPCSFSGQPSLAVLTMA